MGEARRPNAEDVAEGQAWLHKAADELAEQGEIPLMVVTTSTGNASGLSLDGLRLVVGDDWTDVHVAALLEYLVGKVAFDVSEFTSRVGRN